MITKPNLSEAEIQQNYQEFIAFVGNEFKGERKERLLKMYSEEHLGLSLAMSPASTTEHFHLCHPGGYIQHVMNVVRNSFAQKKVYEINGGTVDWTDEEMVFAALHHDLGKLGDPEFGDYYVAQNESWKEKKGELYKLNPNLPYMEVTDRAVFLLQKYGIPMTWKEYLGIKLADGIYNEASKKYLIQYNPDLFLKTDLPRIIHLADYLSCFTERNVMVNSKAVERL
jgi:hypothetical protein